MSKRIHVRPGKGQSKMGFGVGIIFCLIGLFVAIPTFGLFGIFWTAIAGWITYVNYKNGFTDEQIDSHVIDIEDDGRDVTMNTYGGYRSYSYEEENATNDNDDMETRLRKLQSLYDQSLITYEEYEQKKKEILEEL
ncbi:MAG: SHOCT domain-containing protein [Agathobacter sp.]|nr:SHOCT domain-containing protein [Agathobacter sp.]